MRVGNAHPHFVGTRLSSPAEGIELQSVKVWACIRLVLVSGAVLKEIGLAQNFCLQRPFFLPPQFLLSRPLRILNAGRMRPRVERLLRRPSASPRNSDLPMCR